MEKPEVDEIDGIARRSRVVEQIDGRGDAPTKADEGAGDGVVVPESADGVTLGDIRQHGTDAMREISRTANLFRLRGLRPSGAAAPSQ